VSSYFRRLRFTYYGTEMPLCQIMSISSSVKIGNPYVCFTENRFFVSCVFGGLINFDFYNNKAEHQYVSGEIGVTL
jgi:hypothetical protein